MTTISERTEDLRRRASKALKFYNSDNFPLKYLTDSNKNKTKKISYEK